MEFWHAYGREIDLDIREFLEKHIDLIDQNNFTELYKLWPTSTTTGQLTTVLLDCGINPLEYMTTVPNSYEYNATIQSIEIPSHIRSIGEYSFSGCDQLKSITIPDSVTSIGFCAFYWCTGLTSVTIGNSVTRIDVNAFGTCSNLKSVVIPDSVTFIGRSAFMHCENLTTITIPNSVTEVGTNAFYGCNKLVQIIYNGTLAEWRGIQRADASDVEHIKIQCVDGEIRN